MKRVSSKSSRQRQVIINLALIMSIVAFAFFPFNLVAAQTPTPPPPNVPNEVTELGVAYIGMWSSNMIMIRWTGVPNDQSDYWCDLHFVRTLNNVPTIVNLTVDKLTWQSNVALDLALRTQYRFLGTYTLVTAENPSGQSTYSTCFADGSSGSRSAHVQGWYTLTYGPYPNSVYLPAFVQP